MIDTTVIFDLGNVIVFFDHTHLVDQLARTYDLDRRFIYQQRVQLESISKEFDTGKISPEAFTDEVSKVLNRKLEMAEFKKIWNGIFTENIQVTQIVRTLKAKVRLFAMSNTNTWHFDYIKESFDFVDLFDDLILSFRLGYGKPDKRIFERALELSEGSKQILYFDDMPEYVAKAKKLGINAHQYIGANELREVLGSNGFL